METIQDTEVPQGSESGDAQKEVQKIKELLGNKEELSLGAGEMLSVIMENDIIQPLGQTAFQEQISQEDVEKIVQSFVLSLEKWLGEILPKHIESLPNSLIRNLRERCIEAIIHEWISIDEALEKAERFWSFSTREFSSND